MESMRRLPEAVFADETVDPDVLEARLIEILRNQPELLQYVTQDQAALSKAVFSRIPQILAASPHLLSELIAAHTQIKRKITMLIIRDFPLVFARIGESTIAFAPVMGCTIHAVDDVFRGTSQARGQYDIVGSDNGLLETVFDSPPGAVLVYDRRSMDPVDYIALGLGVFHNEVFRARVKLQQGQVQLLPLSLG